MKVLKLIFLVLLALVLVAATGVFIFFQTFDTDQYLAPITHKVSLQLGRPVAIGHLGLGLSWEGISLDAGPLTVADDPDFTTEPFIKIERVRVIPDWGALILQHKIRPGLIILDSPEIHFIVSPQGNLNVYRMGAVISDSSSGVIASERSERSNLFKKIASSASPPRNDTKVFGVEAIGPVHVKIRNAAVSFIDQTTSVPMDIWLNNINARLDGYPDKPFQWVSKACFYSNTPNVRAHFTVSFDPSQRSVEVNDLMLSADFSHLNHEGLDGIAPSMKDSFLFENISGVLQLNLGSLDFSPAKALETQGQVELSGFALKNFNIIQTLFSPMLEMFGGLDINKVFKGSLQQALNAPDTNIDKAQVQFSFHDKQWSIDDSLVQTNILEFKAHGSVDQGANVDLQTTVHLNQDISDGLVDQFKGLKYLEDDSQRIALGGELKGMIPHLKYKLSKDVRKKGRKALMQEGGNILGALLGAI